MRSSKSSMLFSAIDKKCNSERWQLLGIFGALWGMAGVFLLLSSAVYRLFPMIIDSFLYHWIWYHWLAFVLVILAFAYAKGYRVLQRSFSPRVAARARYLKDHPEFLRVILAPLFCLSFFHAPKKRRLVTISVTVGIILLVIQVRLLQQPWRGIIDGGVVIGLVWGLVSLCIFSFRAMMSERFDYPPEVPDTH